MKDIHQLLYAAVGYTQLKIVGTIFWRMLQVYIVINYDLPQVGWQNESLSLSIQNCPISWVSKNLECIEDFPLTNTTAI